MLKWGIFLFIKVGLAPIIRHHKPLRQAYNNTAQNKHVILIFIKTSTDYLLRELVWQTDTAAKSEERRLADRRWLFT
jgi:hypothetical protein